jgi:TetR/AcrR family transcriptional regulator, acrEF/envCD operon repressor
VALGVVHYVYRSKDESLRDVAVAATQELGEAATRRIVPGGDLRENLRHGIESIWQIVEAGPDAQLALYELTTYCLRNPDTVEVAAQQYRGYGEACAAYLGTIEEACGVRFDADREALARLLETVIDGGMLAWLADRDTATTFAAIDLFIGYLLGIAHPATQGPGVFEICPGLR